MQITNEFIQSPTFEQILLEVEQEALLPVAETPAFKSWFSGSKITNESGNPLIVYHGTPDGDFNEFQLPSYFSSIMSKQGAGHYFTDKKNAEQYMNPVNKGGTARNPKLFEVYLSINNPLEITSSSHVISKDQFKEIISKGNDDWFFTDWIPFQQSDNKTSKSDLQKIDRETLIDKYVDAQMKTSEMYGDQHLLAEMTRAFRGDHLTATMQTVFGKDGVKYTDKYGDIYVAWSPTQIKSATHNLGTFSPDNPDIRYRIDAFHGSPHDFNRFAIEKIGTGEQNQAYGHGLYFAGNKEVAEWYRDKLSASSDVLFNGEPARKLKWLEDNTPEELALRAVEIERGVNKAHKALMRLAKIDKDYEKSLEWFEKNKGQIDWRNNGKLYEVSLPLNDADMLDWDKPISGQSEKVKKALEKVGLCENIKWEIKEITNDPDFLRPIWGVIRNEKRVAIDTSGKDGAIAKMEELQRQDELTGEKLYKSLANNKISEEAASRYLNSIGIHGIKYLDGISRTSGEGNYNYVIFDDNNIEIQKKYRITSLTNQNILSPFTIETIRKAFPYQIITKDSNHFNVKLTNGNTIRINPNWEITIDLAAIKDLYPNGLPVNAKAIASYQNGTINLSDLATLLDLHHEVFHAAYAMALNKTEVQILTNKYGQGIPGEEKAAKAYEEWTSQEKPLRTTIIEKTFGKIHDFLQNLKNVIIKDEKTVFHAISDGHIWDRKSHPSITETLKPYINNLEKAFPLLVELGKQVYQDGYKSIKKWLTQMNNCLGSTWDNFKFSLKSVYTTVQTELSTHLSNQCGSFAGTNALTTNYTNLDRDKELDSTGVSPKIIQQETGCCPNRSDDAIVLPSTKIVACLDINEKIEVKPSYCRPLKHPNFTIEYQNQLNLLLSSGHSPSPETDKQIITTMFRHGYKPHEIIKAITSNSTIVSISKEESKSFIKQITKEIKQSNNLGR